MLKESVKNLGFCCLAAVVLLSYLSAEKFEEVRVMGRNMNNSKTFNKNIVYFFII
ncbi:hypothetical protein SAMN05216352_10950 [Alteribacillus bidgolensis]|uniref:Uncharacterized protein n=1 Tax=Alteribacillus bidgolensis TaxID=930129 RepID=A0A1G8LRK0_9BACI|nr:hypothetical protein SAMN05216352_10950 [Alteribacillus bidgolensis]